MAGCLRFSMRVYITVHHLVKGNIMGQVKKLFEQMVEVKFKQQEKEYELNEQEWAQYQAEFNAWLDNYEQSFGEAGKEGEL